uniref:Uncharacterized protein n=1 Tax=Avena sativa TaxID=4498 RepID=A0ACD5Y3N1_AVESA
MAPAASASLLPAAAVSDAEAPQLPQDGVAVGKNNQSQGQHQQLECPRCQSSNTKFCYYNNYSTTQPRHFCRACRRYWTHGGTLRNVPVGGACRRAGNKRRRSADPSPAEDAAFRSDMLPRTPFFPFLSDGAVFLPQFDLGLGGSAAATPTGFPWTAASAGSDLYDGPAAPWGSGGDGMLAGSAWGDFNTGLDLTWPQPPAAN